MFEKQNKKNLDLIKQNDNGDSTYKRGKDKKIKITKFNSACPLPIFAILNLD